MRKIETALSVIGWLALLVVLPTWSYVSTAASFKGVTGGALIVDSISRDGYERYDVCPPGRYTTAQVQYNYVGASMLVDLTQLQQLFGRGDVNRPASTPWPYWQGTHPTINGWPRTSYVALKIDVPVTATTRHGRYQHAETVPGPALYATISDVCGDFTVSAACSTYNAGGPGSPLVAWKLAGQPGPAQCAQVPGRSYYLNIRMRNPAEVRPKDCGEDGTAPKCKVTLLNNFTN